MPKVRDIMTASPHTIGRDQSVAEAARRMRAHRVRHLPVLEGGALVGLLSDRDVRLVESLDGPPPEDISVGEVMTSEVFAAQADDDLAEVVATMAERRIGSVVVMKGANVIGILTTTDALGLLVRRIVVRELSQAGL
jgi:acetoin utilization protein AcuB